MISSHRSLSPKVLGPPTPALAKTATNGERAKSASDDPRKSTKARASDTSTDAATCLSACDNEAQTSSSGPFLRPTNNRRMPSLWDNSFAVAAPMPEPAPVIRIVSMPKETKKARLAPGLRCIHRIQISRSVRMQSRIRASQL